MDAADATGSSLRGRPGDRGPAGPLHDGPIERGSLAEVEDRLLRFQDHYQRAAVPFQWTFTRQDLTVLLAKLAAKERLQRAA